MFIIYMMMMISIIMIHDDIEIPDDSNDCHHPHDEGDNHPHDEDDNDLCLLPSS